MKIDHNLCVGVTYIFCQRKSALNANNKTIGFWLKRELAAKAFLLMGHTFGSEFCKEKHSSLFNHSTNEQVQTLIKEYS